MCVSSESRKIKLIHVELTASLSSLGKICWMRLEHNVVRFTIIPDQGTQVWAQIPVVRVKVLISANWHIWKDTDPRPRIPSSMRSHIR